MAIPRFESVLHKPAEADEAVTKAYLSLVTFKQSMDEMEEIPSDLQKLYDQTRVALDGLHEAREGTHQLRMMLKRALARYER
jgi:phytoene/squalene synthetase